MNGNEMPQEGEVKTNKIDPNRKAIYSGGQWYELPGLGGTPGGQQPKMTEGQAKAGFNASRMQNSSQTLSGLEGAGYDGSLGGGGAAIGRDDSRNYSAAKSQWKDALIRETTGAAATKPEVEAADRTYFPQFGDSPAVRKHKAQMRAAAEQNAFKMSGPGQQVFAQQSAQPKLNLTPKQQAFYSGYKRSGAAGTEGNPYYVATEAGYNSLASGAHYVDPDGNPRTKR